MSSDDADFDRSPTPRKKSGSGPMIAMIVIGLALVGGLVFALFYFMGGSSHLDKEMLTYLPDDSQMVVSIDVNDLLNTEKVKNAISNMAKKQGEQDPYQKPNKELEPAGITLQDFDRVVLGMQSAAPKGEDEDPSLVVRFKKAPDQAKLAKVFKYDQTSVEGGKTYYQLPNDRGCMFFVNDKLAVFTSQKHLKSLINRESGKIGISKELQDQCKLSSQGQIWMAATRKFVPAEVMAQADMAEGEGIPGPIADMYKDAKGMGVWAKIDGDNVKFGINATAGSDEAASKAKDAIKAELDKRQAKKVEEDPDIGMFMKMAPPDILTKANDLKNSLAISQSGANLELSGNVSISGVESMVGAAMNMWMQQQFDPNKVRPNPDDIRPPTRKTNPPKSDDLDHKNDDELELKPKNGIPKASDSKK